MNIITDSFPANMFGNTVNMTIIKTQMSANDFTKMVSRGITAMVKDPAVEQLMIEHGIIKSSNDNNPDLKGYVDVGDTVIILQKVDGVMVKPLWGDNVYETTPENTDTSVSTTPKYAAFSYKILKYNP